MFKKVVLFFVCSLLFLAPSLYAFDTKGLPENQTEFKSWVFNQWDTHQRRINGLHLRVYMLQKAMTEVEDKYYKGELKSGITDLQMQVAHELDQLERLDRLYHAGYKSFRNTIAKKTAL